MIPQFALQLICGLSTIWMISPREKITSGFFRIQMLLVMGLSVLFTLTASQLTIPETESTATRVPFQVLGVLLALLAYAGSMAWTLERRKGGSQFGGAIAVLSSLSLLFLAWNQSSATSSIAWLLLDSLTAAWLIGAATAAMLIGHWYLTATGMSLEPFTQYNRVFMLAALLRIFYIIGQLFLNGGPQAPQLSLQILRWAGLIGPLIMAYLTIRILRYRNTQSATGLLYAATTLVFMGEMAGNMLNHAPS